MTLEQAAQYVRERERTIAERADHGCEYSARLRSIWKIYRVASGDGRIQMMLQNQVDLYVTLFGAAA